MGQAPFTPDIFTISDFIRWLRPKIGSAGSSTLELPLKLDYTLVLGSMAVIVISVFSLSVVRDPIGWYGVTVFRTLSGGYEAALRSLALSLYARQVGQDSESGKLLGGLSVLGLIR